MPWTIEFCDAFTQEFLKLPEVVQDELLSILRFLEQYGPEQGRPQVDTLYGSKHSNMKELRFNANKGVWRVAFAFDPQRSGIVLVAGNKAGKASKTFYKALINKADKRFDEHLATLTLKRT
jgi:hypothetical protein